jgi:uncharacterized membrane protein
MTSATTSSPASQGRVSTVLRAVARVVLGAGLTFAGVAHLTVARQEFQAQVPPWVPLDPDLVVVASGVVEIVLGLVLVLAPTRLRPWIGVVAALFFAAVFPGNISQYVYHVDGFGLDTDAKRAARLPFQLVLVVWALWSTRGWNLLAARYRSAR